MRGSWPVITALRKIMGMPSTAGDGRQRIPLDIDLAPMGSSERVTQLKALTQEFQQLLQSAADAHKENFRPRNH